MVYRNDSYEAMIAMEISRTGNYGEEISEPVSKCGDCGCEIYDGEDYLECESGMFCRRCIMAMTSEDVVELLGFRFKPAERLQG